jgi:hypothetical protein
MSAAIPSVISIDELFTRLHDAIHKITGAGASIDYLAGTMDQTNVGPCSMSQEVILSALGKEVYRLGDEAFDAMQLIKKWFEDEKGKSA